MSAASKASSFFTDLIRKRLKSVSFVGGEENKTATTTTKMPTHVDLLTILLKLHPYCVCWYQISQERRGCLSWVESVVTIFHLSSYHHSHTSSIIIIIIILLFIIIIFTSFSSSCYVGRELLVVGRIGIYYICT